MFIIIYNISRFIILPFILILIILLIIRILYCIICYSLYNYKQLLGDSYIYYGRVSHSRLKGGSTHHIDYPIFFACIDIKHIQNIKYYLWPIFIVNDKKKGGWLSFSSLDYWDHLKGYQEENKSLYNRLCNFNKEKSNNQIDINKFDTVQLVTHLTYFGYCFNPVSFYYIYNKESLTIDTIVTEVSNTPWIEQHSYILHESIPNVIINRDNNLFNAQWNKEFHVSPFMEMDYKYNFTFTRPNESIIVNSKMFKQSTNEIWFTANFKIDCIDFSPINLLYVLLFYPLHTRIIQLWIHIEAIKLWWKGIPTFMHPNNPDINFGFGITDKLLLILINRFIDSYNYILRLFISNKSK